MSVRRIPVRRRDGTRTLTRKYYVEVKIPGVGQRRIPGFTDARATRRLEARILRLAACKTTGEPLDPESSRWLEQLPGDMRNRLARYGLLGTYQLAAGDTLDKHLDDFGRHLALTATAPRYVSVSMSRLRAICETCGFRFYRDITADVVGGYLAELRRNGLSTETTNQYLRILKQFCRWMLRNRRAFELPVAHMRFLNAEADRRRVRRALSPEEIVRLLDAARTGPVRRHMSGPERALLYRLALETGLRASELRSLKRSDFNLDAEPPVVTVQAAHSKRRRKDTLILRQRLAAALRLHLAGKSPDEKCFTSPSSPKSSWRTARMLRADLEAAGIPYKDAQGRVVDFHSLRHTFISSLARHGVHPKVAQELARHSSIELTMQRYTHVPVSGLVEALGRLPDYSGAPAAHGTANLRPTGSGE